MSIGRISNRLVISKRGITLLTWNEKKRLLGLNTLVLQVDYIQKLNPEDG